MNKDLIIKVDNLSVKGVLENSDAKKLVILVHGFTGDLHGPDNIFEKLSKKLQQLDYAVIRFSFRGTPPSEGEYVDMIVDKQVEDLKKVIEHAKSLGYFNIALLGESMGGSIVAKAYDQFLKAVIFWYPAFDFVDTAFKNYLTDESQRKLVEQGFLLEEGFKVGKQFIDEIPDVNLFNRMGEIKCPILFLHGDKDSEVPYQQSEKAFQIANDLKEIHIIKGADHCFSNEQDEVVDLTAKFLQRFF
ncbi:lysophospholipase [Candidatus Parcubacteria bacterium]|nr:lysophospholipase [Patescibacteria group bacterium]MBU4380806.1 lysophospholipase [Patescibacteria group bacterium]MCG2689110.1 lysophospholipase [Candidatus Parcubacteria bacterium]